MFYKVPKALFTEEKYKPVSTDAKMLYGLLLDRIHLSAKNGWTDKRGRVYQFFTVKEAQDTLFCGPNCRAKFYRQEAAEGRSRACTCENCGKEFITTRSDVKYCSDDCRYAAQIKRQGARKKALREAKNEKEAKTA